MWKRGIWNKRKNSKDVKFPIDKKKIYLYSINERGVNMKYGLDRISDKLQLYCQQRGKSYVELVEEKGLQSYLTNLDGMQKHIGNIARAMQHRRNEAIFRCMQELHGICERLGIRYAFMKGLCVAAMLYEPREARSFGDVDLLVSPRDARRLAECLLQEGFEFEAGVETEAGINCLAAGHHHMKELYKCYRVEGKPLVISLEIHGFPNGSGYVLYGKSAYDDRFTDELLTRREVIVIDGQPVYTLGKTDNLCQLLIHAASHMANDTVLYLYVNKPFQGNRPLSWLIDVVLYLEKFRDAVDWNLLMELAKRRNCYESVSWLLKVVEQLFGESTPWNFETRDTRKTPLGTVSRLYAMLDPAEYLIFDRAKTKIDQCVREMVRHQGDRAFDGATFSRQKERAKVMLPSVPGLVAIQVACLDEESHLGREFVVEIADRHATLYRDNGYRIVWDPATFGTLGEDELGVCYDQVCRLPVAGEKTVYISICESDVEFPLSSARILVQRVDSFNPFRNRWLGL